MLEKKPILVTGAHRSGTTWVGKMIVASQDVAYISEPLNVWHRRGVLKTPTQYWYTYIQKCVHILRYLYIYNIVIPIQYGYNQ